MSGRIRILTCATVVLLTAGIARAQSAPTCTFDPAAALVTVTVNGFEARLRADAATGEIRLNMQRTMQRYASVFRTGEVLEEGTARLGEVADTLGAARKTVEDEG